MKIYYEDAKELFRRYEKYHKSRGNKVEMWNDYITHACKKLGVVAYNNKEIREHLKRYNREKREKGKC